MALGLWGLKLQKIHWMTWLLKIIITFTSANSVTPEKKHASTHGRAPQAKCHRVRLYSGNGRHLYGYFLQTQQLITKQSRLINSRSTLPYFLKMLLLCTQYNPLPSITNFCWISQWWIQTNEVSPSWVRSWKPALTLGPGPAHSH